MTLPPRILSWLHLSDVHARHGNAQTHFVQQVVVEDLLESLRRLPDGLERVDAVFVTGDLAYSGGRAHDDEYDYVCNMISAAAEILDVPADRVFVVPGNHDVDRRPAEEDDALKELLAQLRHRERGLLLERPAELEQLFRSRWKGWRKLVDRLTPHLVSHETEVGAWSFDLAGGGGIPIRLVGLNTALLSQDDQDEGKLRLGRHQATPIFVQDRLVLALGHHPLEWLADPRDVLGPLRRRVHLYLHGHVHEQAIHAVLHGGGDVHVTSIAGAVHLDEGEGGRLQHAYSFGGLFGDGVHSAKLRVWPRAYDPDRGFVLDARNCLPDRNHAELPVPVRSNFLATRAASKPTHVAPTPPVRLHAAEPFRPPLEVYVAWHGASTDAQMLATQLYRWLHGGVDDVLGHSGLGIPVFFRRWPTGGRPALLPVDFDRADATAIIALLDGPAAGEDGAGLRGWVTDAARECDRRGGRHRVVPICLDQRILRFGSLNANHFVRVDESQAIDRIDRTLDGVFHHLARLLRVDPTSAASAAAPPPVAVFLSHARSDGAETATRIRAFLNEGTGIEAFLDRTAMAPSWSFVSQITDRLSDRRAVLVAILTDAFGSREACRTEVALARRERRPIVVVDARAGILSSGLATLGNAPTLRWQQGHPDFWREFLRTILTEALRFECVPPYLEAVERLWRGTADGSLHVPRRPDPADANADFRQLLHPDPPLVPEELQLFKSVHSSLAVMTPTTLPLLIR